MVDIIPIPALRDNYIWIILNPTNNKLLIVDPGEAQPVINFCKQQLYQPIGILITHHHADHVGGVAQLAEHYNIPVYGPRGEKIPSITHALDGGETLKFPQIENIELTVLAIPGHTAHHIAYYRGNALFCGDTLFAGGCGRVFGGTAGQLFDSLHKLAQLPAQTAIYCAHEYTLANLQFALTVDPNNTALQARLHATEREFATTGITLPSYLSDELATNPFLRTHTTVIQHKFNKANTFETFKALRHLKDNWS